MLAPSDPGYAPTAPPPPTREQAFGALTGAGFQVVPTLAEGNDPETVTVGRLVRDNEQLTLVLGAPENDDIAIAVANTVADQWRGAGIAASVRALKAEDLYGEALTSGTVDAVVGWERAGSDPATSLASRFGCLPLDTSESAPDTTPQTTSPAPTSAATPAPSVRSPSNLSGLCDPVLQPGIDAALRGLDDPRGSSPTPSPGCGSWRPSCRSSRTTRSWSPVQVWRCVAGGSDPGGHLRRRRSVDPHDEVSEMNARRILFVHAHPDDETLTTGGTIARYASDGADVTVLTCTLGEEGEVIGDRWAGLVAGAADQLGGYRIMELTGALQALGVSRPRFLGGAGRWRDSGMVGTPSARNPRAFVNADIDEAIAAIVAVIRELRPHVVVTYDPVGGYGHPDHIQAHRLTTAAVEAAGTDAFPDCGQPWNVAKFYWTVTERSTLEAGVAAITDVPHGWRMPTPDELPTVPDASVTAAVDVGPVLDAKRAAFRAHATQVTVAPSGPSSRCRTT